ncbi:DUF5522 domain-containing protein [Botrimarina sp.]|uniref:DUF5522 domain-containing protein n=1 Tax=Botrimarina sp. TaxID=2795802 RepID=UPI0032F06A3A
MPLDARGAVGPLVAGVDYTVEAGRVVFTARFLLARGRCCGSGCRHCPYDRSSGLVEGTERVVEGSAGGDSAK